MVTHLLVPRVVMASMILAASPLSQHLSNPAPAQTGGEEESSWRASLGGLIIPQVHQGRALYSLAELGMGDLSRKPVDACAPCRT